MELKCKYCDYKQDEQDWISDADSDYEGKYYCPEGDHTRCPECNELIHIDYDLIEDTTIKARGIK